MTEEEQKSRKNPITENLLAISQRPIFPFLILRLEESKKGATSPTVMRLKVEEEVYQYLTKIFGTNELVLYLDPQTGKIELWSPDMHLTMQAMEELGLMSKKTTWLQASRNKLKRALPKIPEEGNE